MRVGYRRGVGRGELEHVGVGARTLLLRQNALSVGQLADVRRETREQASQAGDRRVLAFERGQLGLPGRLDLLKVADDFSYSRAHVEARATGRRPEIQSDCTHGTLRSI